MSGENFFLMAPESVVEVDVSAPYDFHAHAVFILLLGEPEIEFAALVLALDGQVFWRAHYLVYQLVCPEH